MCWCFEKPGRGRPRKDASTKDPLHQLSAPGGVTKAGKTPNVIVVPIQISKEMIAARQGEKAAAGGAASTPEKSKQSPEKGSPKAAAKTKTKGSDADDSDKEAPKGGAKAKKTTTPKADSAEPKSDQSSPEPTRRSKRESKLSSKLAEWGLLPSAGIWLSLDATAHSAPGFPLVLISP